MEQVNNNLVANKPSLSDSFNTTHMGEINSWLTTISMETYAITGLVAVCGIYLLRDVLFGVKTPAKIPEANKPTKPKATRNIIEKINEVQCKIVIFYGSQTGTAEDYANRIAKEGKQRFDITCLVADIENYDMEHLDNFPSDCLAIFIMATYGEGEPTDNANDFYHLVVGQEEVDFSNGSCSAKDKPLNDLRFVIFGLGNRTYEHFNAVAIKIDATLKEFGAQRIGELGIGDDDASLEDDFIGWKEPTWEHICKALGVTHVTAGKKATVSNLKLTEHSADEIDSSLLHLGELFDKSVPSVGGRPTYDAKNPYKAPVKVTRELFASGDRNCIHFEIDIQGTGIKYETGDHVGIWAINPETEVQMFANAFKISDKLDTVVSVDSLDVTHTKKPFPTPTTYASLLRYYVDICSSPSRQFLGDLINYARSPAVESYLTSIASAEKYASDVLSYRLTLAEVYLKIQELEKDGNLKTEIPFTLAIENLGRLLPRYYSISSSNKVHPTSVHVTASVLTFSPPALPDRKVKGLFTNFLLEAHNLLTSSAPISNSSYRFAPSQNENDELFIAMPMYIRRSNFRLPKSPQVPIIMVGPGTGVAPFRGFFQERTYQAQSGNEVGTTVLFYGCRRREEDCMYSEEWDSILKQLPGSEMYTAFSRADSNKVYVQHLIQQKRDTLWELIDSHKASIYVCGDAKYMAKDVNQCFVDMARDLGHLSDDDAIAYVKKLRSQSRYQEDVWA